MQDAATAHSFIIGMGRDEVIERCGAVWILSRLWFELKKPIHNADMLHIKTWNRGINGVMWYRDFSLTVCGEEVGKAVNAWVLADVNTHRVKRPHGLEEINARSEIILQDYTKTLGKLHITDDVAPSIEKVIHYSDLDINVHLNNTKYADLCCDAIHYEEMNGKFLSALQINYLRECRLGDHLVLNTASCDDGRKLVCGTAKQDSKNIFFEASLSFSNY